MRGLVKLLGLGSDKGVKNTVSAEQNSEAMPGSVTAVAAASELPPVEEQGFVSGTVEMVSVDLIVANPFQPRKTFNEETLQELSLSIAEFGVIQPLLVRRQEHGFELIAGERRLRASRLAGLSEVPVIIKVITDKEMAELAMIENLQREDLHFLEEAEGFQQLLANFSFTQEDLARRVGKNQSTIANKLRLLKLSPLVRQIISKEHLTERHARSLLKLADEKRQMHILENVVDKGLNVRQTEALIASYEAELQAPPVRQNLVKIIKDVRIFVNTVNSVIEQMRKSGLDIQAKQEADGEFITMQIKVRNVRSAQKKQAADVETAVKFE